METGKMTRRFLVLIASVTTLGACVAAPPAAAPPVTEVAGFRQPVPYDSAAPLGDISHPVRVNGPFGEREYLVRLRCADGSAPSFDRQGSRPNDGVDSHILDHYTVACTSDAPMQVFMDMYHDNRERRPVGRLSILPELPARSAVGCPPQVGPTADSSARYVFNSLEVETPAEPLDLPNGPVKVGVNGYVGVSFVVDTAGRPEPSSIVHDDYEPAALKDAATKIVLGLHFRPAQHHAGCRVRQGTGLELQLQ
jgi:hypothetical protein